MSDEHSVSQEAADAAATSVRGMVTRLSERRQQNLRVHEGGPSLVDIVRDEMRPLVKEWLDANLPDMVERLVKAEIERVVSRIE